jgi:hypothetical protein
MSTTDVSTACLYRRYLYHRYLYRRYPCGIMIV